MRAAISSKQRWLALLAALFAALVASVLTTQITLLKNLENAAADIRIAALQPPMPQSKDIVIAGITEETLKLFPYRSPVDRAFLASLLKDLQAKGARAIGIDVLFDAPTESDKDALLKKTLEDIKVPTFVSYTTTESIVDPDQLEYLNAFVPQKMRAAANLATDPFDGAVRWIYPGETATGMPKSFPRVAADIAGIKTSADWIPIAWRPPAPDGANPFPVFPAHAIAVMPKDWFEGKFVLVGAILSITDKHRTPLAIVDDGDRGMMPGILIQAHALSQLIEGRSPHQISWQKIIGSTVLLALIGVGIGLLHRGVLFSVGAGVLVLLMLWVGGFLGFQHGLPLLPLVAPSIAMALSLWLMDMMIGRAERKQRQFIQGAFSRYVSPAVVNQLAENPDSLTVKGHRQQVTFLFTDVAGFTTMSEELDSAVLSDVLNDYLDGACEIIFQHAGTIDKFIGDAIMVVFNAPVPQQDHVQRAVRCALALDVYCENFREKQAAAGVKFGVTRIGIHTGEATVGNFGSHTRMDFTALGDTVNTAARTEGVNKYFGTRICCTQPVVDASGGELSFQPIGDVILKGKLIPTTLYTPVSSERNASEFIREYLRTYQLLAGNDAAAARAAVERLYTNYPTEPLAEFHVNRVAEGLVTTLVKMEDK